jgi:predicted ATP-dependent endonuclease of OLD family
LIIESVEVKNFRCIREEKLICDKITALLGRNGCGKSSFLHALDVFYNVSATITKEDFFNRETKEPIEIRVTYRDLRDEEKKEFGSFVRDEKLIVLKRISMEDERITQRYFGATMQIPQFYQIRSIQNKTDRRTAWNNLIDNPGGLAELGKKAKNADEIEKYMSDFEAKHHEMLTPFEREEQFFGSRNIGGGKLDKYTKYVLIPAVKEVSDEVSGKKGAIYQILDTIVLRKIEARKDIREFKEKVSGEAKKLYSADNLKELPELGNSISKTLEMFAPGSKLKLDWEEFEMPEIDAPSAIATLVEDNFEGEIGRKGHGLQRALIFTLLQHLALLVPEEEEEDKEEVLVEKETVVEVTEKIPANKETNDDLGMGKVVMSPDLILAIEEPELYLHPSRCRYMRELLFQLVGTSKKGLGEKNQVLYTTHSPLLIDIDDFEQVRIIRKTPSNDCPVSHSRVTTYDYKKLAEEFASICEIKIEEITRDSLKARATPVMNSIVNEGFFADVVVLVEGDTEVGILWKLQEVLKKRWARLGIVVIPTAGKNKIGTPTLIFRGFSIPTYFIFDADSHNKGTDDEASTIKQNKTYLALAKAEIKEFPETQINKNWAVINDKIEQEMKNSVGEKVFDEIRKEVAGLLGYRHAADVLKNIDGSAKFIEIVYEKGLKVPFLEKMVDEITALHQG